MSYLTVLRSAGTRLAEFFSASPGVTARLAKRIGLDDASPSGIIAAARANPVTAALVALEAGQAGSELLEVLRADHAEMIEQLEAINFEPDTIEADTKLSDLERYQNELDILDDASAILGGDRNLYAVLNACRMAVEDSGVLVLRERMQKMGLRR